MINAEMSVQEKFNQGLALINSKDKDEAEKGALTILGLVIDYPKNAEIKVVYANYLWKKGDIDLAISELEDGVLASPKSEIVSLLLFQILWEQGRETEAVAEIERLSKLGVHCKDYEEIIREIPKGPKANLSREECKKKRNRGT